MNFLIMVLSACALLQPNYDYSDLIVESYNCSNTKKEKINPKIIKELVRIENNFFVKHNIPNELRGMLLAAACNESGYNPLAKGDWRTTKKGRRRAMARGILQFWPWAEKKYGFKRADYKLSAHFWMTHIITMKKRKFCPKRFSEVRRWVVAWTQTCRGSLSRKNKYRCYQTTTHYKRLKRWKKRIKKRNLKKDYVPGC